VGIGGEWWAWRVGFAGRLEQHPFAPCRAECADAHPMGGVGVLAVRVRGGVASSSGASPPFAMVEVRAADEEGDEPRCEVEGMHRVRLRGLGARTDSRRTRRILPAWSARRRGAA
jgi:hypothetical protein